MNDIIWKLVGLGQLALLFEASSPKPGNVNRDACFSDMDYRNFLTSASLISRGLYQCAYRGWELGAEIKQPEQIGLGELIELCVRDSLTDLNTKNTIFGSILLYVPLTVALASSFRKENIFSIDNIENELLRIIKNTTVNDSVHLYRTFELTRPGGRKIKYEPEWLEIHNRYDFNNPNAVENIIQDNVRLIDLFEISAEVDEISGEWANNFTLTLRHILPYLAKIASNLDDIEEAIVRTYIWLLSKRPDGLIMKKAGRRKAEEVQCIAQEVMTKWNESGEIQEQILLLDQRLRREGNLLNPGTTADLVSAATYCRLVSIYFSDS
ncbi:hypothetical protein EU527_18950 [Candidatus Thorarchaeota archaeon]|nr:MAG: hypothetical protein EU527_18950 [Candidatus Thorarchaeota archaeon]